MMKIIVVCMLLMSSGLLLQSVPVLAQDEEQAIYDSMDAYDNDEIIDENGDLQQNTQDEVQTNSEHYDDNPIQYNEMDEGQMENIPEYTE